MKALIYKPAKTAMQSGKSKTQAWILEFRPSQAQYIEPLMGWTGMRDTRPQIKLYFATAEEACEYAQAHRIDYRVILPASPTFKPKSYGDNFRADRIRPSEKFL